MKRALFALCLSLWPLLPAAAELSASAGGQLLLDSSAAELLSPQVDATVLGDNVWLAGERLGFSGDYSGTGSYQPIGGISTGLFMASAHGSYLTSRFLSRLSLCGLLSVSNAEALYAAASSELLFSYGGLERSVFAAPRLAIVEESGSTAVLSAKVGAALLLGDSLLVRPTVEAGVALPAGAWSGWSLNPTLSADLYGGGPLTFGLKGGYKRSSSSRETALVTGGPLLPLDTFDRYSLGATLLWLIDKGNTLEAQLPVEYSMLSYEAFEGSVDQGAPTWLASIEPSLELTLAMSEVADIVLSVKGSFVLSNNSVQRLAALASGMHVELHLY